MFTSDRTRLRGQFLDAWKKSLENQPLSDLEALIVEVIAMHPEYHEVLQSPPALDADWLPEQGESNPFLHLGMHIAIREQLAIDRPAGIRKVYQRMAAKYDDVHTVEHIMMEALGETMWEAQRDGQVPDEARYLERLQQLADRS